MQLFGTWKMIRKEEEVSKEISKWSEYGAQLPDTFPNTKYIFHVC